MTTDPHDEHGEILRRALNAEADSVNPAGDGLERIRARIADGSGSRFGLGRFGFDRFTVNWARPVLAVAAAVAVAGLGVTAPQTIDLIQQSVGSNGSTGGDHDHAAGGHSSTQGDPEYPDPSTPGGSTSGSPTTSQTPASSTSPGLSSCGIQPPPDSPTIAASPGSEPAGGPTPEPCPSEGGATQAPTTTPEPPATTSPDPGTPTQEPTTAPSPEPTKSAEQGAGAGAP